MNWKLFQVYLYSNQWHRIEENRDKRQIYNIPFVNQFPVVAIIEKKWSKMSALLIKLEFIYYDVKYSYHFRIVYLSLLQIQVSGWSEVK